MNRYTLLNPVITEKSLRLATDKNIYSFWVSVGATKNQVREAVKELYKVVVTGVNTVVEQRNKTKTGKRRLVVLQPKKKKALVSLAEGHKIDLFEVPVQSDESSK